MRVATVTTSDSSLLQAVRTTLAEADEALLCVAFAQERGIRLLEREFDALREHGASVRLMVTTTFSSTPDSALSLAHELGLQLKVLNPGLGTFHPKLYLGRAGTRLRAVVGSANLTGGLATNLEAAVALDGQRGDEPLDGAWAWAERLWGNPSACVWHPVRGTRPSPEAFEEELFQLIDAEWRRDPVFLTLGRAPRRNRVTELTRAEAHVQTERSLRQRGGSAPIPAWMFNLAWDRLRTHGSLTNDELLNDLRVHRSSAVCAILSRLPGIALADGPRIRLLWARSPRP